MLCCWIYPKYGAAKISSIFRSAFSVFLGDSPNRTLPTANSYYSDVDKSTAFEALDESIEPVRDMVLESTPIRDKGGDRPSAPGKRGILEVDESALPKVNGDLHRKDVQDRLSGGDGDHSIPSPSLLDKRNGHTTASGTVIQGKHQGTASNGGTVSAEPPAPGQIPGKRSACAKVMGAILAMWLFACILGCVVIALMETRHPSIRGPLDRTPAVDTFRHAVYDPSRKVVLDLYARSGLENALAKMKK